MKIHNLNLKGKSQKENKNAPLSKKCWKMPKKNRLQSKKQMNLKRQVNQNNRKHGYRNPKHLI